MAIKSKKWTAIPAVKICCVVLIPVMAFVFLCGVLRLAMSDIQSFDEDMLFTSLNNSDYFFNTYMPRSLNWARRLRSYSSEENIRDMGYLEWRSAEYDEYSAYEGADAYSGNYIITYDGIDSGEYIVGHEERGEADNWYELVSTSAHDSGNVWGSARGSDLESPEAKRMVEGAINSQLAEFRTAKEWLETANGLYYYVQDGERVVTNIPDGEDVDFFRLRPVYLIERNGQIERQGGSHAYGSYLGDYYYRNAREDREDRAIYLAYSQAAVDAQNAEWRALQRQIGAQAAIMGGSLLAALILIIILVLGTGRRRADGSGAIHFTALDRLWLDFGLVALIAYEALFCNLMYLPADKAWQYQNIWWLIALCGVFSAGFTLPLLCWFLSFVKRCKAGKWWRHTLVYYVWDKFMSFIKSLWAGFPLTLKAVLAGIAIFVAMSVVANIGWSNVGGAMAISFMLTAGSTVIFLQYARRLHLLELGAKAASGGSHNAPIAVKGGELGSIASSINNISEGINEAVAERMKSERLKTELITNVSHDIRTPLTSLITYTDLLKNEGLDCEKAPEYLEVLIQKSARLKTLTDDLFEAAKAASGSIEAHPDDLDLADLVRQVLGELDERVSASGLDFRPNLPEHAPVLADGKLLWRVMENIFSNVFKYALKGSRVYIDVTSENGEYRLDVKNISQHPLNVDPAELTERFKRGDSARTDEGSGLGLSIAQSFVQAQGGRFDLSIDGDLFKVTLYLPEGERPRQAEKVRDGHSLFV